MRALPVMIALVMSWPAYGQDFYRVEEVAAQPALAHALRVDEALAALGHELPSDDRAALQALRSAPHDEALVAAIQEVLDPYCIALVHINPEARVKAHRGPAPAELMQSGWKSYLVKVHNEAGVTSELNAVSPQALPVLHRSSGKSRPEEENLLSPGEAADRFLELSMYRRRPMEESLSGLALEYAIVQMYTNESGTREVRLGFNVGRGTEDLAFRDALNILFQCEPSVKVILGVKDVDGRPTTASFIIRDDIDRLTESDLRTFPKDYRHVLALRRPWEGSTSSAKRLLGVYPLPARRVAAYDEYPDFFFHPQIYRADGEHVYLPPGEYDVTVTRGPEYLPQERSIIVPNDVTQHRESFQLERWVHMAARGWYSADHHVHAGGCSHYESPEAGVNPASMFRQALGEDLNISCVLTWGPCWYHQKTFFQGGIHPLSTSANVMRYDVEVSGFPSSHAGHIVLLRLEEDDYPGTTTIEEWPSWGLPVLEWGKNQEGVTGYAHSGWGLEPQTPTTELPNYGIPKFDGIGANEFIVTTVHDAVDFISAVDTPAPWELNIWYHTLNCGFRTRISGETDFPCIFDDRVGMGRSYAPMNGALDFDRYVQKIAEGANYVSDGKSHIIDFRVDRAEMGVDGSELLLSEPSEVRITAQASAYLPEEQDAVGAEIRAQGFVGAPYWDIEKARIGQSREVEVELIQNGRPVGSKTIIADGQFNALTFDVPVEHSSWFALRILPSSHTNPIFVLVNGKPIRASKRSAQWCIDSVDKCWEAKHGAIRDFERPDAEAAYDFAREAYRRVLAEAVDD